MSDKTHEVVARAEALPTKTVLHPAVEQMLAKDPTPEALEKILALQEKWEAAEAKRAYAKALVSLHRDLPAWIKKDQTVSFKNVYYTHTSLAEAMEAVTGHLTNHGFAFSWKPATPKGMVSVTAILMHSEGHSESCTIDAPIDSSGSKSPAQGVASTITLLQRYSLLALLGIATKDMKEPQPKGTSAEGAVDSARNMTALNALIKTGKTKAVIEEYVGRAVQKWTSADLDKLREWIKAPDLEAEQPVAKKPEPPI